jgi:hypothetical protein
MMPSCLARRSARKSGQRIGPGSGYRSGLSRPVRGAAGRAIFIAVLAAAFLTACDDPPAPKAPAAAATPGPAKTQLAQLPPQMVAAVSSGKASEAISVHFALEATPAIGKELPVSVAIVPHQPFASVRALFEGPESLGMSSNHFEQRKDVASEVPLMHKFTLHPAEEGVFLITTAVETEGDDGQVTRIFSIPVIIHPAGTPAKPAGNPPPAPPAG